MDDDLRFSDRDRLAREGSLGPARTDEVPDAFRRALAALIDEAEERDPKLASIYFRKGFTAHCRQHFGANSTNWFPSLQVIAKRTAHSYVMGTVDVLDMTEILVEEATRSYSFSEHGTRQAFGEIETRLNPLFLRHRFGYRLEGGTVRRVGSPALDIRVVEPAGACQAR